MQIVDKIFFDPITKGLRFFGKGGSQNFSSSPQGMSDAQATALGLKVYAHNVAYNGNITPTLTFTNFGASQTPVGRFIPYQMQDGTWRLRFNISVNCSATTAASTNTNIAGVSFKTMGSGLNQSFTAVQDQGSTQYCTVSRALSTSGDLNAIFNTTGLTLVYMSGDVELNSKPTWAY